ncbi:hypothetical protein B0H67DRAFT_566718 [Lasiosphaeris hirsuta]|uniref:Uncharacterized protein n=1 Tax=Lasiosphaeris hirsuta TaxID=260670 RepID=A0AA40ECA4_9PEZI|nr:hypothetical protein B0H67DRAFT_566718 [Lasiosphaeris hirsuta]
MAPSLIPFGLEGLSATYLVLTRTLVVEAKGEIPRLWLNPSLDRTNWPGAFKFKLEGYPGGLNPSGEQQIDVKNVTVVNLPRAYFDSTTVLVETATKTYTVPITYDPPFNPLKATAALDVTDDISKGLNGLQLSDVLPPITKIVTGGEQFVLTARIPTESGSTVDLRFNPEYFQLLGSWLANGDINWRLQLTKFPVDKANPQLIEVETHYPVAQPNPFRWSNIIQGYIIRAVLLKE